MGTLFSLSKSATSVALDSSEIALLVFGVILVIGVVGEYSKSSRWIRYHRTFEILVIIGVGGELVADGSIFLFSRHYQTISETEIAALNRDAKQAQRDAESAKTTTRGFEKAIAEANRDAMASRKDAEIARKGGEQLRLDAEKLRKDNLILQGDLLRFGERIADRHLTPEQQSRIAKSLCRFGGIGVDIGKYSADGEIEALGKEMEGALPGKCDGNPGFEVSIVQKIATPGFSGIRIIVKEGTTQKSKSFADALAATLKQEGLQVAGPMPDPTRGTIPIGGSDFSVSIGSGIEPGTPVEIAIGKKP